ncbi:MAG TPA: 50S ribosomal protein L10 [Solirubrobacterales bacterium]|nr:50S ribosomal protein L10 [Solirubrobacterales bacterium]
MNREEKSATIEEIAGQIEASEAIFAVDYRGISVPQAAELRGKLREADASFRIVKNRLTKLAAEKAGEDRLAELLQGPTALTFVRGDTAQAAKAITTFNKEHEVLTYKGGFMDGTSLDESAFKSIAKLPSRDVLNGQLAGVVASPLTGLVRGLGSMIQGLALQLGQIAEKGLVTGEAPSAATAGPVDDGDSSSSRDDAAGEESPSSPPAGEAEEAAPSEETEGGEGPAEEPQAEAEAPAEAEAADDSADSDTSEDSNEEEG